MSTLHTVTVREARPEGEGSTLLVLGVEGGPLGPLHTRPGQYLTLVPPAGEKGFFALAQAPGQTPGAFEVLVREGGPAADALRRLSAGASVQASTPAGNGFALDAARGRDVVLLAQGSGISALRAVIQAIAAERPAFGRVVLLQGDRSVARMSFAGEHAHWRAAEIEVRPVVSREEGPRRGHVQHHLGELALGRAVVFLAGGREMMALTRLTLAKHQVGPDRIFTNY